MSSQHGKKRKRKQKRQPNKGSFQPGFDPRRHTFTAAERKLGYARCLLGQGRCSDPHVCAWVFRKVRSYYRDPRRHHGQEENGRGGGDLPC